jgi:hypothetical protein
MPAERRCRRRLEVALRLFAAAARAFRVQAGDAVASYMELGQPRQRRVQRAHIPPPDPAAVQHQRPQALQPRRRGRAARLPQAQAVGAEVEGGEAGEGGEQCGRLVPAPEQVARQVQLLQLWQRGAQLLGCVLRAGVGEPVESLAPCQTTATQHGGATHCSCSCRRLEGPDVVYSGREQHGAASKPDLHGSPALARFHTGRRRALTTAETHASTTRARVSSSVRRWRSVTCSSPTSSTSTRLLDLVSRYTARPAPAALPSAASLL